MKIIYFSSYPCKTESVRCYQASKVQRPLWSWVIRKIFASNFSSSSSECCDVQSFSWPSSFAIATDHFNHHHHHDDHHYEQKYLRVPDHLLFCPVTDHHYDHDHCRNYLKWYEVIHIRGVRYPSWFNSMFEFCQKMIHSIFDSILLYPKIAFSATSQVFCMYGLMYMQ